MNTIELEHNKTDKFGGIITIIKDGVPCARLRQIGKGCPPRCDVRLEWLTWQDGKATEHGVQFPFVSLADVTIENITPAVKKYNL